MCGIVGYIGPKPVVGVLLGGLRKLEYRGYDSAGLAVVRGRQVSVRRSPGKLSNLVRSLESDPLDGEYGIGHTRWATHGRRRRKTPTLTVTARAGSRSFTTASSRTTWN